MNTVEPMNEVVRRLRAEGRKRATVGAWHVTLGESYALFEHEDDRARRLEAPQSKPAPVARRKQGRRRQLAAVR